MSNRDISRRQFLRLGAAAGAGAVAPNDGERGAPSRFRLGAVPAVEVVCAPLLPGGSRALDLR